MAFIHPAEARDWWLHGNRGVAVLLRIDGPAMPLRQWIGIHHPDLLKESQDA